MAETESIGSVSVDIKGDYAPLMQDLQQAHSIASQSSQSIAQAFTSAGASADTFEEKVQALIDSGHTLGEALAQLQAEAQQAGNTLEQAGSQTESTLTTWQTLKNSLIDLIAPAEQAGESIHGVGEAAHEAESGLQEFVTGALALGGVVLTFEGLKEAVTEAFGAFAKEERAQESLTALIGSSEEAERVIEGLKGLAQSDAISFPSLLQAAQRMQAFGFETNKIPGILDAAANASRATGASFETATSAIDRMAAAGMAGGRQLATLGLTSKDLADAMGVSAAEAQKLFKALDVTDRLSVLNEALSKFDGLAKDTANDLTGQWQQLKNTAELTFADIGKQLAPLGSQFIAFAGEEVKQIGGIISSLIQMGEAFTAQSAVAIAAISALAVATGNSGIAVGLALVQMGLAWRGMLDAQEQARSATDMYNRKFGELQIAMTQHFGAYPDFAAKIKSLNDQVDHGAISQDQYQLAVRALNAEFQKQHPILDTSKAKTDDFATAVSNLKAKLDAHTITAQQYSAQLQALIAAHTQAAESADTVAYSQSLLEQHMKDAGVAAASSQKLFNDLFQKYQDGKIPLSELVQAHQDLKKWMDAVNGGVPTALEMEQNIIIKHDQAVKTVGNEVQAYISLATQYGSVSVQALDALGKIEKANKEAGLSFSDLNMKPAALGVEMVKSGKVVNAATDDLVENLKKIGAQIDAGDQKQQTTTAHNLTGLEAEQSGVKVYGQELEWLQKISDGYYIDNRKNVDDAIEGISDQVLTGQKLTDALQGIGDAADGSTAKIQTFATHAGAGFKKVGDEAANAKGRIFDLGSFSESVAGQMGQEFTDVASKVQDFTAAVEQASAAFQEWAQGVGSFAPTGFDTSPMKLGNPFSGSTAAEVNKKWDEMMSNTFFANPIAQSFFEKSMFGLFQAAMGDAQLQEAADRRANSSSSTAPSPVRTAASTTPATSSSTGNSLIDWLNSLTSALTNVSSATGGTNSLPDWVKQLSDALATIQNTALSPSGPTLPDWVQQLSDIISQATQGKNIIDLTQLGDAIQGVLQQAMPAADAVTQFGQSLGAAGMMITSSSTAIAGAAQTLANASTSLYAIQGYKPPSFQTIPSVPTVPTSAFNPAGAAGPPGFMAYPISPSGGVTNNVTVNGMTVSDPSIAQQMITLLQRSGVRM